MGVFRFKFKTVHSLKRQFEDQAKMKLGAATAVLAKETARLDAIYRAIELTIDAFRTLSGGVFAAGRIREYNQFIAAMKEKAAAQRLVVAEAEAAVEAARRELVAAARQREMYDKLREKHHAVFMEEEKRAEQLSTDELISYRGSSLDR